MRILDRGTGLQGLGGIAEMLERGKYRYIRPLLPFSRKQLECYMTGRPWVEDPTNGSTDIRRNLFRHEVIPYLEKAVSLEVGGHIAQLSDTARDYNEVLAVALDHFWDFHRHSPQTPDYIFDKKELAGYTDDFILSALAHLLRRERGYTFGSRTLRDIVGFLRGASTEVAYDCLTIRKYRDKTVFRVGAGE